MTNVKEIEWQGGIYNIADETARGEAQQARALANTAQTTADNAQTSANNAQTTADNAQALTNGIFQTLFSGTDKHFRENIRITAEKPLTFTMPKDGIVLVNAYRAQPGYSLYLQRGSTDVSIFSNYAGTNISGVLFGMFKKNDVVALTTNAPYGDEGFLINYLSVIY